MNPSSRAVLLFASLAVVAAPSRAGAQYTIDAGAGGSLAFDTTRLRVMLDSSRALYRDLEEDPRILYTLTFGPPAPRDSAGPAYPWNAVTPQSDSTVLVVTPGSLREADRAYHNYAVMRMRVVRSVDPDDPCDRLMEAEEEVVSSFVDGWILARTLFGGPAYAPLDELAFARDAGHLRALIAARGDASLGVCADEWAAGHPDRIEEYEAWRAAAFPSLEQQPPEERDGAEAAEADEADEEG